MGYVIGVDQGGSGTRAAISTLDGRILGAGAGPGACHAFTGMPAAMHATETAVEQAWAQSGLHPIEADIYLGGHTGADWDDEYDLLRKAVTELGLARQALIVNDSIAALRGGTQQSYGAILVAGTGANCALRSPDGREFIYHYYHDAHLQGGSAIGRAALNAIYRAETGRPPQTNLRARVLQLFDLPDVDSLMRGFVEGGIPENRTPEIAPLVFAEAEKGDPAARKIVADFGNGCAELLTNGIQRLGMTELEFEIVLSGGIFKAKSNLLREVLQSAVFAVAPKSKFIQARYEPVVGAVLLALEHCGIDLEAKVQANIEDSALRLSLIRFE